MQRLWSFFRRVLLHRRQPNCEPASTLKSNRYQEKCFEGLGCVKLSSEWWHNKHRPVNYLPSDRFAVNTVFLLWKLDNGSVSSQIINDLDSQNHLKILIHDFTSNGYAGWIQRLSRALLFRQGPLDVVSVNWAAGAEPPYAQAVANARLVALEVTHFLNRFRYNINIRPNKVHIIGHGLGAHIAGYVGKMSKLGRITALDPSGVYFMKMPPNVRLHKNDAYLVEVVHTDNMPSGQGYSDILGHVDFYPNGGKNQPGCVDSSLRVTSVQRNSLKLGETLSACSHKRGLKYYIESLIHPTCYFLGFSCPNFKDFTKGKCSRCGDNMQFCSRLPVVKEIHELNNTFGFHFLTSSSAPYCVEVLKVLMVIKSKFSSQSFVKGHFNVTIPQAIGDVNFLLNENHAVNALNTDDHHVFMVFRSVPPPLLLPSEAVHIKWIQGTLPNPWSSAPEVTGFMVYKMTDSIRVYFMKMPPNVRLHKNDAYLVEVVHTDNMPSGQGYSDILGHVDFYPNGGKNQPGCVDSSLRVTSVQRNSLKLGETLSACSHKRGLKYYIESLIHPTCYFLGFSCPNFKDFTKGKCSRCGDNMQFCSRLPVVKEIHELNNTFGFHFLTSSSAPYCVEVLKVLMVIKSKFSSQSFVKGHFNVTIPQAIGDVNFLLNENHAVNALNTDDHHVFMVFRSVPPPLLLPSEAVHIKWIQGTLPNPWSSAPEVTGFMVYKMTDSISRPQWFCALDGSPSQALSFGLQPCNPNKRNESSL